MATNPYRDFGLHPDEFGSPSASVDSAQQPPASLPPADQRTPRGSVLNWKRVGMVLIALAVTAGPKAFLTLQRRAEQRAQQQRAQQQQLPEIRRQEKMVRDLNTDIEAVRSGKKKAGPAFHRLFGVPETPENTIKPPAAPAAAKGAAEKMPD